MLNPHTMRILVWFVFSMVGCIFFWIAFGRGLIRAQESLHNAMSDCEKHAGMYWESFPPENPTNAFIDAHKRFVIWKKEVESIKRQRRYCLIATPGVIAIMSLFY
ncbi:hypothetical protein PTQ57_27040 [Klebsiella pasteurii]|uniref:hypothetical protein n=1 Tax=Klebsiella pasteurii TaxID=2587529 RepID=UPI00287EAD9C|nr:hypothetical protein [Klebsiella pasteurii]MDS7909080.1 hypothetical protein [Klebsiella pasteurii]MDV0995871.1 hypothetical protein [Klebsiella pasteurii]